MDLTFVSVSKRHRSCMRMRHHGVKNLRLPGTCSCLGHIPRGNDRRSSSSSPSVACTPTSTGRLRSVAMNGEGMRARPGDGEGGLSRLRARQGGPWHLFLLCSMKSRMSPREKVVWHCPQVNRSCSVSTATRMEPVPFSERSERSEQRSDDSSSEATADKGSAGTRNQETEGKKTDGKLEAECSNELCQ
ncbi:hypothetical protein DPEC_G00036820 [Dallia pectoralis]|uniref:Uncharacterized protein n=1 Tax=Dallia pectoralis TaxID=75939 RepID=A0ACC2HE45_DALPE|nr:hypothetical protein DPEC_G00036820 [Dallia pectoralis]